jgi:hypothetical protein
MGWFIVLDGVRDPLKGGLFSGEHGLEIIQAGTLVGG